MVLGMNRVKLGLTSKDMDKTKRPSLGYIKYQLPGLVLLTNILWLQVGFSAISLRECSEHTAEV